MKNNYIAFARIGSDKVGSGPGESTYYSEEKEGVYYLYR